MSIQSQPTVENGEVQNFLLDAAESFGPERALQLLFVNLGEDNRPKPETQYPLISASSEELEKLDFPKSQDRRLDLDLYQFFVDDMPDWGKNEGLLKIQVTTKNPQDLSASPSDASTAIEFSAKDGHHAPGFLYRGIYRNIIIEEWAILKFELYELDTDVSEYYKRIRKVVDDVPEIKNLDVLKGIPYLNLATKLFDGIITNFGKNPDDHLWGELPLLEINPNIGGAFLRSGIYVLMEQVSSDGIFMKPSEIHFKNGRLDHQSNKRLSSHLIFGIGLRLYDPNR